MIFVALWRRIALYKPMDEILEYFNFYVLMEKYLDQKRSLAKTKEELEYEEYKGIFPGFRLDTLRAAYESQVELLRRLEKYLLSICPSLDDLMPGLS